MRSLSVVHLAQSDSEGGANKAAYRIHKNLQQIGVESTFHVGRKRGVDASVLPAHLPGVGLFASDVVAFLNARQLKRYPIRPKVAFSPIGLRYGCLNGKRIASADVVCAHWIAGAFLNFNQLKAIHKPIVWRLSDVWPFSGGCHYPGDCSLFEAACGTCPQLASRAENDLSRDGFQSRARVYPQLNLTIAAPSRWIAGLARRSSLFGERRIEHIPTGVDLTVFRPRDRQAARARFVLPAEGPIVLFGALGATEDPRKGYAHLIRAVETLAAAGRRDATLVIFGGAADGLASSIQGFPVRHLGKIESEEALSFVYSAADVLVAPFLEDNLPNVVIEAGACGTPVVAFAAGGIPDAIDHEINGYLATLGRVIELADGIEKVLDHGNPQAMRDAARAIAVDRFDILACSRRYKALFEELATTGAGQNWAPDLSFG